MCMAWNFWRIYFQAIYECQGLGFGIDFSVGFMGGSSSLLFFGFRLAIFFFGFGAAGEDCHVELLVMRSQSFWGSFGRWIDVS